MSDANKYISPSLPFLSSSMISLFISLAALSEFIINVASSIKLDFLKIIFFSFPRISREDPLPWTISMRSFTLIITYIKLLSFLANFLKFSFISLAPLLAIIPIIQSPLIVR